MWVFWLPIRLAIFRCIRIRKKRQYWAMQIVRKGQFEPLWTYLVCVLRSRNRAGLAEYLHSHAYIWWSFSPNSHIMSARVNRSAVYAPVHPVCPHIVFHILLSVVAAVRLMCLHRWILMTHEFVKRSNEMGKIMFEVVISNLIMKETKPNATQMSVLSASVKRCALKCVITLPNVAPIASRKSIHSHQRAMERPREQFNSSYITTGFSSCLHTTHHFGFITGSLMSLLCSIPKDRCFLLSRFF